MTPVEISQVQTPVLRQVLQPPIYRFLRERVTVGKVGTCPVCACPPTTLFLSPYDAPNMTRCMECVLYAFLTNADTYEALWILENSIYCVALTDEERAAIEQTHPDDDDIHPERG